MGFKKLTINGWKQFDEINIDFHPRLTILTGANGSGKTTLLNQLARHFGWNFIELSTPVKDKSSGTIKWLVSFLKRLTNQSNMGDRPDRNKIGEVHYEDNSKAELILYNNDSPQYQISIEPQQPVEGLNIVSHRDIFRYQHVGHIPTSKRTRSQACQIIHNDNMNFYTAQGGVEIDKVQITLLKKHY
jgi:ABC-type cobalamin/Fe3+-siderophores transport system ATPase subunit